MTPEIYIANAIQERGMKLNFVSQKTGISYSRLQPSMTGRRELRADEYLVICQFLGLDPRGFKREQTA